MSNWPAPVAEILQVPPTVPPKHDPIAFLTRAITNATLEGEKELLQEYLRRRDAYLKEREGQFAGLFMGDKGIEEAFCSGSENPQQAICEAQVAKRYPNQYKLVVVQKVGHEGKVKHNVCLTVTIEPNQLDDTRVNLVVGYFNPLDPKINFQLHIADAQIDTGADITTLDLKYFAPIADWFHHHGIGVAAQADQIGVVGGMTQAFMLSLHVGFAGKEFLNMPIHFTPLPASTSALIGCDIIARGVLTVNANGKDLSFTYH